MPITSCQSIRTHKVLRAVGLSCLMSLLLTACSRSEQQSAPPLAEKAIPTKQIAAPLLLTAQETVLTHPAPASTDSFGRAVALSADGTRAIVGAFFDDTTEGTDAGSAHIFLWDGDSWALEATLAPVGLAATDQFGSAVALSDDGTRAIVGAQSDDLPGANNAGSARVFSRAGSVWTEEGVLTAPTPALDDNFGISVAFNADASRAIVGAFFDDAYGFNSGTAHVYVRALSSWSHESELPAIGIDGADSMGISVALDADATRAIVGAEADNDPGGATTGSARVFTRSVTTWSQEDVLIPSGALSGDSSGYTVDLSADGSRALLGNYRAGGTDVGSGTIFLRTGVVWTEESTLVHTGAQDFDNLGVSGGLSADGRIALLGAYRDDEDTIGADVGSGRVFVRQGATWTEQAMLIPVTGTGGDQVGYSSGISSDGAHAILGAWMGAPNTQGFAPVFALDFDVGDACSVNAQCSTGFCNDGVCCATDCGSATDDCQACSVVAGSSSNGSCETLDAATVCRSADGDCDVAEECDGESTECPEDGFDQTESTCRPADGDCDVAETCAGDSADCPADGFDQTGSTCRNADGDCDVAETCAGDSADCPADGFDLTASICRNANGDCDVAETCTGTSADCPIDGFDQTASTCRSADGDCDVAETCAGDSADCPADGFDQTASTCRPADGDCDVAETCAGDSADCPADGFDQTASICRNADGDCDVAETCAGDSADCPADGFDQTGSTCRPADGDCDVAETCEGDSADCPTNDFIAGNSPCGDTETDTTCDAPDTCDGAGNCEDNLQLDGASCDDDSECTINDGCSEGTCSGVADSCKAGLLGAWFAEGNTDNLLGGPGLAGPAAYGPGQLGGGFDFPIGSPGFLDTPLPPHGPPFSVDLWFMTTELAPMALVSST
ncbi:MAG TPA: hypothetical protein VHO25_08460, partial [Polyangiaceae bacterium]|nr:hypothetical protein [Polyangiaceae bacterium]